MFTWFALNLNLGQKVNFGINVWKSGVSWHPKIHATIQRVGKSCKSYASPPAPCHLSNIWWGNSSERSFDQWNKVIKILYKKIRVYIITLIVWRLKHIKKHNIAYVNNISLQLLSVYCDHYRSKKLYSCPVFSFLLASSMVSIYLSLPTAIIFIKRRSHENNGMEIYPPTDVVSTTFRG